MANLDYNKTFTKNCNKPPRMGFDLQSTSKASLTCNSPHFSKNPKTTPLIPTLFHTNEYSSIIFISFSSSSFTSSCFSFPFPPSLPLLPSLLLLLLSLLFLLPSHFFFLPFTSSYLLILFSLLLLLSLPLLLPPFYSFSSFLPSSSFFPSPPPPFSDALIFECKCIDQTMYASD